MTRKLQRLEEGQTLTKNNLDEMINFMQGTTDNNITAGEEGISFTDGSLEGSEVIFTENTEGLTETMKIRIKEKANYSPLRTTDYKNYYIPVGMEKVVLEDPFAVYKNVNITVDPAEYTLMSNGQVTFNTVQSSSDSFTIVCNYHREKNFTIYRGPDGEPAGIHNIFGVSI